MLNEIDQISYVRTSCKQRGNNKVYSIRKRNEENHLKIKRAIKYIINNSPPSICRLVQYVTP